MSSTERQMWQDDGRRTAPPELRFRPATEDRAATAPVSISSKGGWRRCVAGVVHQSDDGAGC